MDRVLLLLTVQSLFEMVSTSLTTIPITTFPYGWGGEGGENGSPSECRNGFSQSLSYGPLTTFDFKPKPNGRNDTKTIAWTSYGKSKPQLTLTICHYTSVIGLSFETSNVKSSGVIIDGESYYGAVDQYGMVKVTTGRWGSWDNSKTGWVVKVSLTPISYQAPVVVKNFDVKICEVYYDCFVDCAVYVLDPSTGCKKPMCVSSDPCGDLFCNDDQECRLIDTKDYSTFPSFMTSSAQLWGCVDKARTDYGCVCQQYGVDNNQCPTCNCVSGTTTKTTATTAAANQDTS